MAESVSSALGQEAAVRDRRRRLGDLPGGSKWQFFVTTKASLAGRTPLAADGFIER